MIEEFIKQLENNNYAPISLNLGLNIKKIQLNLPVTYIARPPV